MTPFYRDRLRQFFYLTSCISSPSGIGFYGRMSEGKSDRNSDGTNTISNTVTNAKTLSDKSESISATNAELTQYDLSTQISNLSVLSHDRKNRIEKSVTHYANMEKLITRMPQFYQADEFIKCLSKFTMEKESLDELGRLTNGINSTAENMRYEIIIENQRGATLFGSKFYSKESVLYPLDPPKYQTLTGKNLMKLSMYPEPASNWRWSWNHWHIMMINDVDEDGWIYSSMRFGSYHWSGVGKFGNFVRRRIWIRMVERVASSYGDLRNGDDDSDVEETLEILPGYKDTRSRDVTERLNAETTKGAHKSLSGPKVSTTPPIADTKPYSEEEDSIISFSGQAGQS